MPASFAFPPSRDEPCGKLFVKLNLAFYAPAEAKQEVPQLQLHSLITWLSVAAISIHDLSLHGQFIFKLKHGFLIVFTNSQLQSKITLSHSS